MGEDRQTAKWLSNPNAALAARVLLGCVFIYASFDKIRHPKLFAEAVYNYQLAPEGLVNLVAIWLPWLEFWSGALLVLGLWVRGSVLILGGLMLVFLTALVINLARGLDIHCGCFTTKGTEPMTILTLFRDFFFLLLALYLFWVYQIKNVAVRFSLCQTFRAD